MWLDKTSIRARTSEYYCRSTLAEAVFRLLMRGKLQHFETRIRPLMPFADALPFNTGHGRQPQSLTINERDYLKLVDASGRIAVHCKRGPINPRLKPVLEGLALAAGQWKGCLTPCVKDARQLFEACTRRLCRVPDAALGF